MPGGVMPSWPRIQFRVALAHGADGAVLNSNSVGWLDLGPRLRGPWSAPPSGRQYELDQVQSGTLTLTLENKDRLLDPTNTSSPVASYMVPMRPCKFEAVWPPTQNRLPSALASGTTTEFALSTGAMFLASGLVAAPSGHTTASSWAVPAATPAGAQAVAGTSGVTVIDSTAITVTPGEQITLSAYLSRQAAGGDTTVQSQVALAWYGYDETYLSTNNGSVITVPRQSSWLRAIATATAPAGAAYCRPVWRMPNATTNANLLYATGWQWERASAPTAWADPGTVYPLWTGNVERWPQTWDYSGTYGLLRITAIDAMAALATQTLEPSLPLQLKRLQPSRMFPLDEPEKSTKFYDATGTTRPAVIGISRGLGGGTFTSGQSVEGGGSFGNPGPVVNITNPFPGLSIDSGCSFLVLDRPGPPATGGWTRVICFRTTVVPLVVTTLWGALGIAAFTGSGSQSRALMYLDPAGQLNVQILNAAGLGGSIAVPSDSLCDGNWHLATMGLSSSGLVMNASVDGEVWGTTLGQDSHPTACVSDLLGSTATYPTGANLWNFSGDLAYATEVPSLVPDAQLTALGEGFADGWTGDTTWARMGRILDLSGYQGPWRHGAANSRLGGFPGDDTDVMSSLQVLADSEAGAVFVPGDGSLTVHGRAWRFWQTSPVVTFGEDAAAGEVPYNGDFLIDHDPTRIYNTVTVTNSGSGGSTAATTVSATDYASQAQYLPRPLTKTTNLDDNGAAADLAAGLLYEHADAHLRVSAINVDVSANPSVLPALLTLRFDDRVRVRRRPPVGSPIVLEQFVEQITWAGDADGRLQWRAQLSPAPDPSTPWAVATSLQTTLAAAASAGAGQITLSALAGSSHSSAASELGTSTQLLIGSGASAETRVVTTVAPTSPGYSTVVVGIYPALSFAHSSGEPVVGPFVDDETPVTAAGLDPAGTITATGPLAAY